VLSIGLSRDPFVEYAHTLRFVVGEPVSDKPDPLPVVDRFFGCMGQPLELSVLQRGETLLPFEFLPAEGHLSQQRETVFDRGEFFAHGGDGAGRGLQACGVCLNGWGGDSLESCQNGAEGGAIVVEPIDGSTQTMSQHAHESAGQESVQAIAADMLDRDLGRRMNACRAERTGVRGHGVIAMVIEKGQDRSRLGVQVMRGGEDVEQSCFC
jgi:hypothetical protein